MRAKKGKKIPSAEYAHRILSARKKNNFIFAGDIINEAKRNGVRLTHLSILTDIAISTLSNMSVISKRSTVEMKRWASQGKLGFKALREIVRMPDEYQGEVAEKLVKGEFTTLVIDQLRQRLIKNHKEKKNIDLTVMAEEIRAEIKADPASRYTALKQAPERRISAPDVAYTVGQVRETMQALSIQMASMRSGNLAQWEKAGITVSLRVLEQSLENLRKRSKIESNDKLSKMQTGRSDRQLR